MKNEIIKFVGDNNGQNINRLLVLWHQTHNGYIDKEDFKKLLSIDETVITYSGNVKLSIPGIIHYCKHFVAVKDYTQTFRTLFSELKYNVSDENSKDDIQFPPEPSSFSSKENNRTTRRKRHAEEELPDFSYNDDNVSARKKLDNDDLKRKFIFENEDRFRYFSEFIDGYIEAHGLRGIKDRNISLLEKLRNAKNEDEENRIIWSLVENNRPLAKRTSMIKYAVSGWADEDARDAYQDTLLKLAETYKKKLNLLKTMNIDEFQKMTYYACKNANCEFQRKFNNRQDILDNDAIFNEIDTCEPIKEYLNIDIEYLFSTMKILTPRERYVIETYFFGDPINGIKGLDEDSYNKAQIAKVIGVTRERTRQIIEKSLRKIKNACVKYNLKQVIFYQSDTPEHNVETEMYRANHYSFHSLH